MRTLDVSVLDRPSRTAAEWLWPLVPIGIAVFCLSALVYFRVQFEVVQVRSAMQVLIANGIYRTFGFAPAVMFFLLLLTWSSIWFVTGRLDRPLLRVARLLAMALMMGVFLNLGDGGVAAAAHKGVVGAWLAGCLVSAIGYYPSIVLVWAVTFASLLLATDFFFSDSFERLRHRPRPEVGVETSVTDHLRGLGTVVPADETEPRPTPLAADAIEVPELDFLRELPVAPAPMHRGVGRDVDAAAGDAIEDSSSADEPRRRRSYFDRRREVDEEVVAAPVDRDLDVAAAAEWGVGTDRLDAEFETTPVSPARPEPADAPAANDSTDEGVEAEEFAVEPAPMLVAEDATPDAQKVAAAMAGIGDEAPPAPDFVPLEPAPTAAFDEASDEAEEDAADTADEAEEELVEGNEDEPADADWTAAEPATTDAAAHRRLDEAEAEPEPEAQVAIPRPDQPPRERVPSVPRTAPRRDDAPVRQQKLFAAAVDDDLLQEALDLVAGQSRVSATLLQRRLRIDYQTAIDVLAQLGSRGVIDLDADATQGRVVV